MDPLRRASLIQKIIHILKELKRPDWFKADRILKDIVEPEIEKTKDEYVRLFYSNNNDKH